MKNPTVVALDMGTSSVRAMLFDRRGRALPDAEVQISYAQRTTADGGVEADAEPLLERTVACLTQLFHKMPKSTQADLVGVGISCFWHSLVGVGADNRAVTPVYSWADTRSHAFAENLRKTLDPARYHSRTGCVLHPSYWPAKLLWLHETQSDLFTKVHRWMSFGEYVALRLFGQASCSISMASATGLFHQNNCDWDDETLHALPISKDQLNPLVDRDQSQSGLTAEWAKSLAPLQDVPWFPALGDGACSNAGSGGVSETRLALNVGTSAAMRLMMTADRVDIPPGLFCYRADRQRFLIGGAFANGGNVYAWLHHTLQLDERPVASRRLGTMPPDSHGLTILPFWAGERSPGWHSDAHAAILGMNLHTTSLDILRASLESLAYQFATVRDRLVAQSPQAQEIIASGGALVHDPVWIQIMADVFGVPVTASKVFEASSRGAALFALQSLGLIKSLDDVPFYKGKS